MSRRNERDLLDAELVIDVAERGSEVESRQEEPNRNRLATHGRPCTDITHRSESPMPSLKTDSDETNQHKSVFPTNVPSMISNFVIVSLSL